jgi:hypothetical protein
MRIDPPAEILRVSRRALTDFIEVNGAKREWILREKTARSSGCSIVVIVCLDQIETRQACCGK